MTFTAGAKPFLQDKFFWLSMIAAPFVWLILWGLLGLPLTLTDTKPVISIGMIILVYPVLEEIVFRGALQGWLLDFKAFRQRIIYLTAANWITSLIFTGMHFINHSPAWAATVIVPSLVFGWARDRYNWIAPSIVLHSFYNAGFILLFG